MFERFSAEARRIVELGAEVAQELGHGYLDAGHLLIAIPGPDSATDALLTCGFDPARARRDLLLWEPATGPDLSEADARALRAIGVDLHDIRRRAEAAFGRGAFDRRRRWHGRRRVRVCGLPFMPEAKRALELALRESIHRGHRTIEPAHVLLGLPRANATATRLLEAQGVDPRRVFRMVSRGSEGMGERGA